MERCQLLECLRGLGSVVVLVWMDSEAEESEPPPDLLRCGAPGQAQGSVGVRGRVDSGNDILVAAVHRVSVSHKLL